MELELVETLNCRTARVFVWVGVGVPWGCGVVFLGLFGFFLGFFLVAVGADGLAVVEGGGAALADWCFVVGLGCVVCAAYVVELACVVVAL